MPKISVLMPVYNAEKYLKTALESVLYQTYQDFELIVINDGSTDQTGAILDQYKDPRIKRLEMAENKGYVYCLNHAFSTISGELIARMDADDKSLPTRFEKQVDFLNNNPDVGVLGTQIKFVDENLDKVVWNAVYPTTFGQMAWTFVFSCCIAHPSVMLRRSLFDSAKFYDEDFSPAEDYELWTRLLPLTRQANLPETLLLYRRHPGAVSTTQGAIQRLNARRGRQNYLREALGVDVQIEEFEVFDQTNEYAYGINLEQAKRNIEIMVSAYLAIEHKGWISKAENPIIFQNLMERISAIYLKPPVPPETVYVTRAPTREEIYARVIEMLPKPIVSTGRFLKRKNLIPKQFLRRFS